MLPGDRDLKGNVVRVDIPARLQDSRNRNHKRRSTRPHGMYSLLPDSSSLSETVPVHLQVANERLQVRALLDTGAISGNYVSPRISAWLHEQGARSTRVDCRVCSGIRGMCIPINTKYTISLIIYDELTKRNEIIPLSVIELDMCYDVIIGRQSIVDHSLLYKLGSYFRKGAHRAPQVRLDKSDVLQYVDTGDDIVEGPSLDEYAPNPPRSDIPTIVDDSGVDFANRLRELCRKYQDVFRAQVLSTPAKVSPMKLDVDIARSTLRGRDPCG